MTIKEAEKLTGMPRASIRFYEAEGLICPDREKNGYRVYTQEHVDALQKIRLLRALEIPLEDIRALAEGSLDMEDCLSVCAARLEAEQNRQVRAAAVCRRLAVECGSYREMNAAYWLSCLEKTPDMPLVPEKAEVPRPGIVRRLLARGVDGSIYLLIWELIQAAVFRANLTEGVTKQISLTEQVLENLVILGLLLLWEPLFLWAFGTTPGKWIMGIFVTDDRGERVTYRDAAVRSWMLVLYGYGLGIPVVTTVRQIKSLWDVRRGEEPEWEWDTQLQLREKSRLKPAALLICCAVLFWMAQTEIRKLPEIPPNRGELTAAEFAENFNVLQEYYDRGTNNYIISGDMRELTAGIPWKLDADGKWVGREDGSFYAWIYQGEPPHITLHTDENGAVSGVRLLYGAAWEAGSDSDTARRGRDFQKHIFLMRVIAQAFGRAVIQDAEPGGWQAVQDMTANGWRESLSFVYRNIEVSYHVEFSGCAPAENGEPRLEDAADAQNCRVSYAFTVRYAE